MIKWCNATLEPVLSGTTPVSARGLYYAVGALTFILAAVSDAFYCGVGKQDAGSHAHLRSVCTEWLNLIAQGIRRAPAPTPQQLSSHLTILVTRLLRVLIAASASLPHDPHAGAMRDCLLSVLSSLHQHSTGAEESVDSVLVSARLLLKASVAVSGYRDTSHFPSASTSECILSAQLIKALSARHRVHPQELNPSQHTDQVSGLAEEALHEKFLRDSIKPDESLCRQASDILSEWYANGPPAEYLPIAGVSKEQLCALASALEVDIVSPPGSDGLSDATRGKPSCSSPGPVISSTEELSMQENTLDLNSSLGSRAHIGRDEII